MREGSGRTVSAIKAPYQGERRVALHEARSQEDSRRWPPLHTLHCAVKERQVAKSGSWSAAGNLLRSTRPQADVALAGRESERELDHHVAERNAQQELFLPVQVSDPAISGCEQKPAGNLTVLPGRVLQRLRVNPRDHPGSILLLGLQSRFNF